MTTRLQEREAEYEGYMQIEDEFRALELDSCTCVDDFPVTNRHCPIHGDDPVYP